MFTLQAFYKYSVYMAFWTGITAIICYMGGADVVTFGLGGLLLTAVAYVLGPNNVNDKDLKVCTFNSDSYDIARHTWAIFGIIVISTIIMLVYSIYFGSIQPANDIAIVPFDMTVPNWMEVTTYSGELANRYNML
jgi:hypothetical protein